MQGSPSVRSNKGKMHIKSGINQLVETKLGWQQYVNVNCHFRCSVLRLVS
jgi:hypothetical protein